MNKKVIFVCCFLGILVIAAILIPRFLPERTVDTDWEESESAAAEPDWSLAEAHAETDLAAESDELIRWLIRTGAGDESGAELERIRQKTALLADYYTQQSNRRGAYLERCREVYQTLWDVRSGKTDYQTGNRQIQDILAELALPETVSREDMRLYPAFSQNTEEDIRLALTACYLHALRIGEQEEGVVSITFAGDTTFGQYPEVPEGLSFTAEMERRGNNDTFPLHVTAPYFANDSISVLNYEGTLTNAEQMKVKRFRFKGPPEYAGMLVYGNIEAVNLANNHSYDYFEQGFEDTKRTLDEYGVSYYGEEEYLVYTAGGIVFGFFGYDLFGLEPDDMEQRLRRDISEVRKMGAEVVIATFHWGYEYHNFPNSFQVRTAHLAVDLGADMVVGHHPHVIQGIESYQGKTILYSLGNFAFGGEEELKDGGDTMLARQIFFREEDGSVVLKELLVVPVNVSTVSDRSNYVPRPLFGQEAERLAGRLLDLSADLQYGISELHYFGM